MVRSANRSRVPWSKATSVLVLMAGNGSARGVDAEPRRR
jgi:hypothetical protein